MKTKRPKPKPEPVVLPATCKRFHSTVILRIIDAGPAVLTVAEARLLAVSLLAAAAEAETTPTVGKGSNRVFDLPD